MYDEKHRWERYGNPEPVSNWVYRLSIYDGRDKTMSYNDYLHICEESKYLISMASPEQIANLGLRLDFSNETKVLDLCCGYGEMLKIWHDLFDIQGVGVDLSEEFH